MKNSSLAQSYDSAAAGSHADTNAFTKQLISQKLSPDLRLRHISVLCEALHEKTAEDPALGNAIVFGMCQDNNGWHLDIRSDEFFHKASMQAAIQKIVTEKFGPSKLGGPKPAM